MKLLEIYLQEKRIIDEVEESNNTFIEVYNIIYNIEKKYEGKIEEFFKSPPSFINISPNSRAITFNFNYIHLHSYTLKSTEHSFKLIFKISNKAFANHQTDIVKYPKTIRKNNQVYHKKDISVISNSINFGLKIKNLEELLNNLSNYFFKLKNPFIHEYTHLIQSIKARGRDIGTARSGNTEFERRIYFNQRKEIEAYYKEHLNTFLNDQFTFDKIMSMLELLDDEDENYLKNNFKTYHKNSVTHLAKTYDSPLSSLKTFYNEVYKHFKSKMNRFQNVDIEKIYNQESKKYLAKLISATYYNLINKLEVKIQTLLQNS